MNDPFAPDWSTAPEWAEWHAVDSTGEGIWMSGAVDVVIPNSDPPVWFGAMDEMSGQFFDEWNGWAWHDSLRRRPEQ